MKCECTQNQNKNIHILYSMRVKFMPLDAAISLTVENRKCRQIQMEYFDACSSNERNFYCFLKIKCHQIKYSNLAFPSNKNHVIYLFQMDTLAYNFQTC